MLQSTLEAVVDVDKFPKASVDVNVLVLQVGWGGDATINCWGQ
jgi:ribonuclease PH